MIVCNGCGNESVAWDKLCDTCSLEVTCMNCANAYKRGQGLCDVNMCPKCLSKAFEPEPEVFEDETGVCSDSEHADEDYGFDYQWEL